MSIAPDTRIQVRKSQSSSVLGTETIVLNFDLGNYYELNDMGSFIWSLLRADESISVAAIKERMLAEFEVDKTGRPLLIPAFPQIKIWQNAVDGLQLPQAKMAPVREGVNKFSWHDSITFEESAVPFLATGSSGAIIGRHPRSNSLAGIWYGRRPGYRLWP